MRYFPSFRKITTAQERDVFADTYTHCSGFTVHRAYYESNQVFGVWWQRRMVGGFVLGSGTRLRTLEVFVAAEHRAALYQRLRNTQAPTEMCCFWMAPSFHKKVWLKFFVWFCVAYALRMYDARQLIFGTNSARLAALYSAASECRSRHSDEVNYKRTFIFTGPRKACLLVVAQILGYKIKRMTKMTGGAKKSGLVKCRTA